MEYRLPRRSVQLPSKLIHTEILLQFKCLTDCKVDELWRHCLQHLPPIHKAVHTLSHIAHLPIGSPRLLMVAHTGHHCRKHDLLRHILLCTYVRISSVPSISYINYLIVSMGQEPSKYANLRLAAYMTSGWTARKWEEQYLPLLISTHCVKTSLVKLDRDTDYKICIDTHLSLLPKSQDLDARATRTLHDDKHPIYCICDIQHAF